VSVSTGVQEFIAQYVDSIETLEILLLLHRSPDTYWIPKAIESHQGMKPGSAEPRLQRLVADRLVIKGQSGGYRYMVRDPALGRDVDALSAEYGERRVAVVDAIYSEKHSALRAFSDAFKIKGE